MKIVTILGARPQFIKAGTVSRAIRAHNKLQEHTSGTEKVDEIILHTGQHFDKNMSEVFFSELDIPIPNHNLGISDLDHGAMTGRMLEGIENLLLVHEPDLVLVYGDTNSTLAGALAAAKVHVPVAHIEAGLRSHNPLMPEEINRILTDRVSSILFCPTGLAMKNLTDEGFPFPTLGNRNQRIENVGDVMFDSVLHYRESAKKKLSLNNWMLKDKEYALCTFHRQENTNDFGKLKDILRALIDINRDLPVVLPLHPRTRAKIRDYK